MSDKKMSDKDLIKAFDDFGPKRKTKVLVEALDYMEQYNGRSKRWCIAKATADILGKEMVLSD